MSEQDWLESLHAILMAEEYELATLVTLALSEQEALVLADTPEIARLSSEMLAITGRMESLESARQRLLDEVGLAGATLADVLPIAEAGQVPDISGSRDRLVALATDLREVQERNARLILGAMRVRERWANLLANLGSSTYGASGRAFPERGPAYLSKSA